MSWTRLNVTKEAVVSTLQAKRQAAITVGAARTCTSADYGRLIFLNEEDTMAIVLPANGALAGSQIDFCIIGSDSCDPTIATATADTLITINDQQADSVNFATTNRIGAYVQCISNGTYWMVFNLSGKQNDMSVTTA